MSVYDKLKELNITLPPVATPAAAYVPFVQTGNLVYLSGHIAKKDGKPWVGQAGKNMTTEEAKGAARAVAIDLMGTLHAAVGDLNKIKRIVKLVSLVNSTSDFTDHHLVTNGASDLLGEVFGVFASFKPKQDYWKVLGVDYLHENSADFSGLLALEELIGKIGAPRWPWNVDVALAVQGEAIYARSTAQGGCVDCHGIKPGTTRFPDHKTWATPIQNVGTDTREYAVLGRQVKTGSLTGAKIPFLTTPLKPTDAAISVLGTAVLGSILQHYVPLVLDADMVARAELSRVEGALEKAPSSLDPRQIEELRGAFRTIKGASSDPTKAASAAAPVNAYEARVLQGVWAAAPYLHNGSVPTLAELLKPASQRVSEFKIGPNYDLQNVGLAVEQTKFNYVLKTTDCSKLNSGNSRCGHEFGTSLPAEEKRALVEYLKTL